MVDFNVPVEHKVKVSKGEKLEKYPDLAREPKMRAIKMEVGGLEMIHKNLEKKLGKVEIKRIIETIHTIIIIKSRR